MKKKKVLFHSDFSLSKTGFGRNARAVLSYLYSTDKYDIISISAGVSENHPELTRTPWKSIGVVPDKEGSSKRDYESSPEKKRMYAYGAFSVDKIVEEERPDVYIGTQDFWGVDYSINKGWFSKVSSAIWTTLDSLPLLPKAIESASKIKNYWIWADFATKQMHKLGHKHVKTLRGCVDTKYFFPLEENSKKLLRLKHEIDENDFIIGFVFRNQLRKTVPKLLSGFKIFKDKNPSVSAKLLLHTGWHEGWNITKLCQERGVDLKDVLTTYICKTCGHYKVRPFSGPELECPFCSRKGSFVTTGTNIGIKEHQLNEVYNLMNVYCHPFTSGGQEIPIQEAKLAGLLTLVTNYSCGEDMCVPEAQSLPLEWDEYSEFGTEFIKASTREKSIADNLQKVLDMPPKERKRMARLGRQWTIDNFSVSVICKKIEKFIDSSPFLEENVSLDAKVKVNPNAKIPEIRDNLDWVKRLYSDILSKKVDEKDEGVRHWIQKLNVGMARQTIENYFRSVAQKEINSATSTKKESIFSDSEVLPENRILVKIDSSEDNIFLSTKIIAGIKKKYPEKEIIVHTNVKAAPILIGNSNISHAFVQGAELNDPQFIKENFYECYSLDDFSIKNNHSTYLK
jgi:glycosyltransferase involved in cell wall biosynthesis